MDHATILRSKASWTGFQCNGRKQIMLTRRDFSLRAFEPSLFIEWAGPIEDVFHIPPSDAINLWLEKQRSDVAEILPMSMSKERMLLDAVKY